MKTHAALPIFSLLLVGVGSSIASGQSINMPGWVLTINLPTKQYDSDAIIIYVEGKMNGPAQRPTSQSSGRGGNFSPGTNPIGFLHVYEPILIPPTTPYQEIPIPDHNGHRRTPTTQTPGVSPTLTPDGETPSGPIPTSTYSPYGPTGPIIPTAIRTPSD